MLSKIETKLKNVASDLDSSLKTIEQQCQTVRWRLANFPAAQAVMDLKKEVGTLSGEACNVARLYGEFRALTEMMNGSETVEEDDGQTPFDHEVEGFPEPGSSSGETKEADSVIHPESQIAPVSGPQLAQAGPAATRYNVIQLLGDTEIVGAQGGTGEYPTFEAAKSAAIDYLEGVMDLCEPVIDELREADTPEQYFGTEVA